MLTLPAVFASHHFQNLANNWNFPGIVGEGLKAGLVLLAGIAVTLLAYRWMRRLEEREPPAVGRALAVSRDRRVLGAVAKQAAGLV